MNSSARNYGCLFCKCVLEVVDADTVNFLVCIGGITTVPFEEATQCKIKTNALCAELYFSIFVRPGV